MRLTVPYAMSLSMVNKSSPQRCRNSAAQFAGGRVGIAQGRGARGQARPVKLARSSPGATGPATRPASFAAEAEFFRHCRALFGVGGSGERMVARQIPPSQIIGDLQTVSRPEMPAQRLSSEPEIGRAH